MFNFFKPAFKDVTKIELNPPKKSSAYNQLTVSGRIVNLIPNNTKKGLVYYIVISQNNTLFSLQLWDKAARFIRDNKLGVDDIVSVKAEVVEWEEKILLKVHQPPEIVLPAISLTGTIENVRNIRDYRVGNKTKSKFFTLSTDLSKRVYCMIDSTKANFLVKSKRVSIKAIVDKVEDRLYVTVKDIIWI